MVTQQQRREIAISILTFEARRDNQSHLRVYRLPTGDGGGTFEVAGINERYHREEARHLAGLIEQARFAEAEEAAIEFIATFTDAVGSWSASPAVESYLRDCAFNRGCHGAGRILQRALGVNDDGVVGPVTRKVLATRENNPVELLAALRSARERYERDVVERDEDNPLWAGLVNRWNKALRFAMGLLGPGESGGAVAALAALAAPETHGAQCLSSVIVRALRHGSEGDLVRAWQSFLAGRGYAPGETDGLFGEKTLAATKAFQRANGLVDDGIAGRQTLLKAMEQRFELLEEPATDNTGSNFPPRPDFRELKGLAARQALFGAFDHLPDPLQGNQEHIRILGAWEADNLVDVDIPQLRIALGDKVPRTIRFHRLAARQLQGLWSDWEKTGLLDRILAYDGAFNPRFIRNSRTTLSNHAFGSAFDINARHNPIGERPALVGQQGSVRELVPLANEWGFYWGGHFPTRLDGMHFEIAVLK